MEANKTNKFDIEKKKTVLFQISVIITLILILVLLEWETKTTDSINPTDEIEAYDIDIELLPPVHIQTLTPPLPKPQYANLVREVDNETETTKDIVFPDEENFNNKTIKYIGNNEENEIMYILPTETKAEFPGGEEALKKFIQNSMQYPQEAKENNIYGKVLVSFRITKEGTIENIKLIKKAHPLLDKEAIRIIQNLPKWQAAKVDNKVVASPYIIPVNFVLK